MIVLLAAYALISQLLFRGVPKSGMDWTRHSKRGSRHRVPKSHSDATARSEVWRAIFSFLSRWRYLQLYGSWVSASESCLDYLSHGLHGRSRRVEAFKFTTAEAHAKTFLARSGQSV